MSFLTKKEKKTKFNHNIFQGGNSFCRYFNDFSKNISYIIEENPITSKEAKERKSIRRADSDLYNQNKKTYDITLINFIK